MTPSSVFGSFTATARLVLSATALMTFAACSPKPSHVRIEPPRIDCEAGAASLIPPIPAGQAQEAEWIVEVLGLYAGEVEKRKAVRQCLQDLRDKGVIR